MRIECFEGPKRPYLSYKLLPEYSKDGQFLKKAGNLELRETLEDLQNRITQEDFESWVKDTSSDFNLDLRPLLGAESDLAGDWGVPIRPTLLRLTIAWASAFFYMNDLSELRRSRGSAVILANNLNEFFLFLGSLSGMRIVGDQQSSYRCHHDVFEREPWFNDESEEILLLSGAKRCINFLKEKYDLVETPVVGDIVAYGNSEQVTHFGQVVSINTNDGEPLVRSKFGTTFTYHHPIEGILIEYGDRFLVFRKKDS